MRIAAVAGLAGVAAWWFSPWREELGPRLRRECVSVVDTVMEQTVPRDLLVAELETRGIRPPQPPDYTQGLGTMSAERRAQVAAELEAARKAYADGWEALKQHPGYAAAWQAIFDRRRDKAIKNCLEDRARREGVILPR